VGRFLPPTTEVGKAHPKATLGRHRPWPEGPDVVNSSIVMFLSIKQSPEPLFGIAIAEVGSRLK
jgi:hypothetical protein